MDDSAKAPLSKKDFAKALECGLGRAFLHVKNQDDTNIEEELVHAVTHSLSYDTQVEGNRGDWMYDMVQCTSRPDFYFGKLMDSYPQDHDGWDVTQKSRILVRLAQGGNEKARELLYSKINQKNFEDYHLVAHDLIDLDGLKGLLAYARSWTERDEKWDDNGLVTYASRNAGEKETIQFLEDAAKEDEDIKKYIEAVKDTSGTLIYSPKERPTPSLSIEDVLKFAEQENGLYLTGMHSFMKDASTKEIEKLYDLLLGETREPQLIRYLRLFSKREIPFISEKIIDLTNSNNNRLRNSALHILSKVKSQRVRDLAIERVNKKDFGAIGLFESNYERGDIPFLLDRIKRVNDKDTLHDACFSFLDVVLVNKLETENDSLVWLYENTPCSVCRERSFSRLVELNAVSADMLNEGKYDCSEDIRNKAAAYFEQSRSDTKLIGQEKG